MMEKTIILFYPRTLEGSVKGRIPYALVYLERMIRGLVNNIILIDEQLTPDYEPIVLKYADSLILAGTSAMTGHQIKGAIAFSQFVKNHTKAPVVWGGWHATLCSNQVLGQPYVDYIVKGQGEKPFELLVKAIINNNSTTNIPSVGYKIGSEIKLNPNQKFEDINAYPACDFSLIDIKQYVFKSSYSDRCIGYFTSHGCPYNCGFCCVAEIYEKKWYHKKIDEIIADIKYFKEVANIDSLTFDDDNFFVNRNFTRELCQRFIDEKLNITWDTSAHAGLFLKLFNEDDIQLFYNSGCRQIYVGAESGDQSIMEMIDKKGNVDDNFRFVKILKKHKITPLFSTMIGFPEHPERDIAMTLDMIRKAKLMDSSLRARIFFYTPYPGTELYKLSLQHGLAEPQSLEEWSKHTLRKFRAPWIKSDYRWKLEIFANFYLPLVNPKFFQMVPGNGMKVIVFFINMFFYPFAYLRFKYNLFRFPLEAIIFLNLLRFFNKVAGTDFHLGFESYID